MFLIVNKNCNLEQTFGKMLRLNKIFEMEHGDGIEDNIITFRIDAVFCRKKKHKK